MEQDLSQRLTWIPTFPRPFESMWSISSKIAVLNTITMSDLRKLIKHKEIRRIPSTANWDHGDWIDFRWLASLLGVEQQRLTQGLWREMGISQSAVSIGGHRVCPECWARGYHCALFDLNIVSSCPLHEKPLREPCKSCRAQTMFDIRLRSGEFGSRLCTRCRLLLPGQAQLLAWSTSDDVFDTEIARHCNDFICWWHDIGARFHHRDSFLQSLVRSGSDAGSSQEYMPWQLHYASKLAPRNIDGWKLRVLPEPALYVEVFDTPQDSDADIASMEPDQIRVRSDAGRLYRSLRRYIYKNYVRPHAKCAKRLKNMTREESLSLSTRRTCTVSLAFLIWRMSIEGVLNVEGLGVQRANNFKLKLMAPKGHDLVTVQTQIRWSFFSFFGILRSLQKLLPDRNIRVERSNQYREGNFYWKAIPCDRSVLPKSGSKCFSVLYPFLEEREIEPFTTCKKRNPKGADMLDDRLSISEDRFRKFPGEADDRVVDILFQLRDPTATSSVRTYAYIRV